MKRTEKEKILELLDNLKYNSKTGKVIYKRSSKQTLMDSGSCVRTFKRDLKQLLDSMKIDVPQPRPVMYKEPDHTYLVTLDADPKIKPLFEKQTLAEVFTATRNQTPTTATNPFLVIDKMTTYRVMAKDEWCTAEQEQKWNQYLELKKNFG